MTEKEYLVAVHAINKFQHYITGYQVFVQTDHAAIRLLMNKPVTNGRVTRWLLFLHKFDITILDKLGKDNVVADFLSRLTISDDYTATEDCFLDEYIFSISTHSPWYENTSNYLTGGKFPHFCLPRKEGRLYKRVPPTPG